MTSDDEQLESDAPHSYPVRLAESARQQVNEARARLAEIVGEEVADTWRDGLLDAIASLAQYPQRCAVAAENALVNAEKEDGPVRQYVYRRTRRSAAWRILFTIAPQTENDPATVRVHHVRHGAQMPMTEWPDGDSKEGGGQ